MAPRQRRENPASGGDGFQRTTDNGPLTTNNLKLETNFRAPREPGERQALAAGLYSGAMIMPPPYRPASAPAASFGAKIYFNGAIYASRRV